MKQTEEGKAVDLREAFGKAYHLDRDPGVKQAFQSLGKPPAAYLRERENAVARAWQGKLLSDLQVETRRKVDMTERELKERTTRAEQYRRAMLPVPPDIEDRIVQLENELVKQQRTFSEGRVKLEEFTFGARDHETAARKALVAALERRASVLGAEALETTKGHDPDVLIRFPHRCPAGAVALLKAAQALAEIARTLDPGSNVLAAFFNGTTEALGVVICEAAGFEPPMWPERTAGGA